ncbi:PEP/pyruvate-binding domain-containing protein [Lentzea sp. NPDC058436]|uniref:PEP/pyruvate-binding domain-containing protein n=1 Tax=Lentzea sp. NPDC058436 TaxID=3346499 RepID=UPI00364FD4F3
MTPDVLWFDDLRTADRPRVGGKCAGLGELIHAGIPVPHGFAVTVDAWRRVSGRGLSERLDGLVRDAADPAALRRVHDQAKELVAAEPLPAGLEQRIRAAYARLCELSGRADLPVAVRSSAVAEDGAATSFAGQQETLLWVAGADRVLAAVRSCWAGLYTPQAIAYRAGLGEEVRGEAVLMGVAVQEMADAEVAGVGFTVSPHSGDPSVMAVNASWGLGEMVVSGEVTPDEYWIDKISHRVRRRTITHKALRCVPSPSGNGTETVAVPEELADAPCLSDEQLAELAAVMLRVERHYGSAQDIEWALTGEQRFVVLQSRPETVVSARPAAPVAVPSYLSVVQSLSGLGRGRR